MSTIVLRDDPSKKALSIFGDFPQSVQNINLKKGMINNEIQEEFFIDICWLEFLSSSHSKELHLCILLLDNIIAFHDEARFCNIHSNCNCQDNCDDVQHNDGNGVANKHLLKDKVNILWLFRGSRGHNRSMEYSCQQ